MEPDTKILELLADHLEHGRRFLRQYDAQAARSWEGRADGLIRALDPHGNIITYGSPCAMWEHARFFRGYEPKHKSDEVAVFNQRFAALEGMLSHDIKLAEPSEVRRKQSGSLVDVSECPFHNRSLSVMPNLVLVLMPFALDWSDRIWKRHIRPAVAQFPLDPALICLRADDLSGQDVMVDIYENIAKAAVVIADITSRNANVFYELGIAHSLGKRVILLTQDIADVPFDLLRFRHIAYSDNSEGCERLVQEITHNLEAVFFEHDKDENNTDTASNRIESDK